MGGALSDLGLGDMLSAQQKDQTEEELRKRKLGMSALGNDPLKFGMTGVASADLLGMSGAGRG